VVLVSEASENTSHFTVEVYAAVLTGNGGIPFGKSLWFHVRFATEHTVEEKPCAHPVATVSQTSLRLFDQVHHEGLYYSTCFRSGFSNTTFHSVFSLCKEQKET
jgi:hypothetical protein